MFSQVIPEKIKPEIKKIKAINSGIKIVEQIQNVCMLENETILVDFYKIVGKTYNSIKPIEVYYKYTDNQDILYNKEMPFNILDLEYSENPHYSEEQCWEKSFK